MHASDRLDVPPHCCPMAKRADVIGRISRATLMDFVLRVQLDDISPGIWRVLKVPSEFTLAQLHRTLQLVFAWQDYHLHDFLVGDRRFEPPGEESDGESTAVRIGALGLELGSQFLYRYDFGDGWEHRIIVEAILPAANPAGPRWPSLLGGERAGPPEDCGGSGGYEELVAALARPRSKAGRMHREWVGAAYDPDRFDGWQVGRMLTLAAAYGAL